MRPARRVCVSLFVLVLCLGVGPTLAAGPPSPGAVETVDATPVPAEILELLQETREKYGPDAVLIQVRLLHRAIRSGSILPAGVRVGGLTTHEDRRYLKYAVETGIVFNSRVTNRGDRVRRLWSDVVVPTLRQVDTYDVPADGIEIDLGCFHRLYRDQQELEQTVSTDSGQSELVTFHLLRADILAFRQAAIDDAQLYARSRPRIDGALFRRKAAGPATR